MAEIAVLRLGHRLPRDERITTHVFLTARAFGASRGFYSGQTDSSLEKSISSISENWGGKFPVAHEPSPMKLIRKMKKEGWKVAHLTMYGLPLPEVQPQLASAKKLLVIVGGEKVPPEIYEAAGFNVAVGSQPHSEVAALALLLDRALQGKELERAFDSNFGGKVKLEPSAKGKKIRGR